MTEYDQKLYFNSDTFEEMKNDMNVVLKRLLGNMIEKQAYEGSMHITMKIIMLKEQCPDYSPEYTHKNDLRTIYIPKFAHKVTSALKINDEVKGIFNNDMEMVMNEESGDYILQPIQDTEQRSIFDSDFNKGEEN